MASTATVGGAVPSSATAGSTSSADNAASSPAIASATAPGAGTANGSAPGPVLKKRKHIAFWDIDGPGVEEWIGTIPGPFQSNGTKSSTSAGGDETDKNGKDGLTASNTTASVANQGTYALYNIRYCTGTSCGHRSGRKQIPYLFYADKVHCVKSYKIQCVS